MITRAIYVARCTLGMLFFGPPQDGRPWPEARVRCARKPHLGSYGRKAQTDRVDLMGPQLRGIPFFGGRCLPRKLHFAEFGGEQADHMGAHAHRTSGHPPTAPGRGRRHRAPFSDSQNGVPTLRDRDCEEERCSRLCRRSTPCKMRRATRASFVQTDSSSTSRERLPHDGICSMATRRYRRHKARRGSWRQLSAALAAMHGSTQFDATRLFHRVDVRMLPVLFAMHVRTSFCLLLRV